MKSILIVFLFLFSTQSFAGGICKYVAMATNTTWNVRLSGERSGTSATLGKCEELVINEAVSSSKNMKVSMFGLLKFVNKAKKMTSFRQVTSDAQGGSYIAPITREEFYQALENYFDQKEI
jgi:hypothetical protein